MNVKKKYAKLMYDYLLETLLEQKQHELYLYVLTAFHTGLRGRDTLSLTWEQLDYGKFKDATIHKNSGVYDVYVMKPDEYMEKLNKFNYDRVGKMFSLNDRFHVSKMIKHYTGASVSTADIRCLSNNLFDWRDCK